MVCAQVVALASAEVAVLVHLLPEWKGAGVQAEEALC